MDRLPVESVSAPSPVTSSDKEIIELTPDMFEKYVDDVEMSDLPEGTTATVLEPSENFPESTVSFISLSNASGFKFYILLFIMVLAYI